MEYEKPRIFHKKKTEFHRLKLITSSVVNSNLNFSIRFLNMSLFSIILIASIFPNQNYLISRFVCDRENYEFEAWKCVITAEQQAK